MIKSLIPAAVATFMVLSPAQALPIPAAAGASHAVNVDVSALTLIADRDRDGRNDRMERNERRREYTPGRRYDRAPQGWNRYGNRRPGDWRSRRCIMVGPVWFCP